MDCDYAFSINDRWMKCSLPAEHKNHKVEPMPLDGPDLGRPREWTLCLGLMGVHSHEYYQMTDGLKPCPSKHVRVRELK